VLAAVLANLVNNLPATLLLLPLVAPLGVPALLAALVGLNVGSGLTYTGSLANLLWRRTLRRHGEPPSARDFHRLSGLVTPPAVLAAVVVLWAWTSVLGV
jgi:arsenical pump membrane protein